MPDTVRLYDLTDSPFCLKARICLNLKRVPYRRVIATFGRMSELRELNVLGQVPVLVVSGRAIADSSQIARMLEEQVPKPKLLPKDPRARSYCHLIEEWADEALYWIIGGFKWLNPNNRATAYAATAEMASGLVPARLAGYLIRRAVTRKYRELHHTPRTLPILEERMSENLNCLNDLLSDKPFILGQYVTLPDIAVFSQLAWLRRYQERRLIEPFPAIQQWMARLEQVDEVHAAIAGDQLMPTEPLAPPAPADQAEEAEETWAVEPT